MALSGMLVSEQYKRCGSDNPGILWTGFWPQVYRHYRHIFRVTPKEFKSKGLSQECSEHLEHFAEFNF